jgi:hypothetical protein
MTQTESLVEQAQRLGRDTRGQIRTSVSDDEIDLAISFINGEVTAWQIGQVTSERVGRKGGQNTINWVISVLRVAARTHKLDCRRRSP